MIYTHVMSPGVVLRPKRETSPGTLDLSQVVLFDTEHRKVSYSISLSRLNPSRGGVYVRCSRCKRTGLEKSDSNDNGDNWLLLPTRTNSLRNNNRIVDTAPSCYCISGVLNQILKQVFLLIKYKN